MIKHEMFNTRRGKAHYYNDNQNNKNKNKRTLQRKKAQVYLGFFLCSDYICFGSICCK